MTCDVEGGCAQNMTRLMERADILDHDGGSFRVHVRPEEMTLVAALLEDERLSYQVVVQDVAAHLRVSTNLNR